MAGGRACLQIGLLAANAQAYTLSPNPNHGSVSIGQKVADGRPADVTVWNATGVKVYEATHTFGGGNVGINLVHAAAGMYVLDITDATGTHYRYKFVIQ